MGPVDATLKRRTIRLSTAAALCALMAVLVLTIGGSAAQALVPLPDPNEPNDSFATATRLSNGVTTNGAVTTESDMDYFYLDVPGSRHVTMDFSPKELGRNAEIAFRAEGASDISYPGWERQYDDDGRWLSSGDIGPGRVFVVVSLVGGAAPGTEPYLLTVSYSGGDVVVFPDVQESHPFYAPIMSLYQAGVISGYKDGTFGPDDPVSRQQFAKMIIGALKHPVYESMVCPFDDLGADDPSDLYPHEYVAAAAAAGITVGTTARHFSPGGDIKLAQVTTMVVRAGVAEHRYIPPPAWYQPPFGNFGEPHYDYARTGAFNSLFQGYSGPWNWWTPATRGQCAFFIWRLMIASTSGD
jgi:hypothetical protein